MPLFLFAFIGATADNGAKIAFNGFNAFRGRIISPKAQTRHRKRKNATQSQTRHDRKRTAPRTAHFFGYSRLFLGSVVFSAGRNGLKRIQAIFDGFTSHGLKAPNGSRTRQGSPQAEHGRSDNRKHAHRQPFCRPLGQPKSPDAPMCEEIVG